MKHEESGQTHLHYPSAAGEGVRVRTFLRVDIFQTFYDLSFLRSGSAVSCAGYSVIRGMLKHVFYMFPDNVFTIENLHAIHRTRAVSA